MRRMCLAVAGVLTAAVLALPAVAAASPTTTATPSPAGQAMASLNPGTGVSPSAVAASSAALCADDGYKAGFPYNKSVDGYPAIVVAVSVALAESSCNPSATNHNTNGSTDRGLWQINNAAQPQVNDACAFNAMCNAIGAYQISKGGTDWQPWTTYNTGVWRNYIGDAESAVSGITVTLYNQNTNRCLGADSTNKSNGGPVFQWACSGSNPYEQWRVEIVNDNLQVLKNVGTGTCLDADGSAHGNGAPVFQWSCGSDTSSYENWILGPSNRLSDYANATLYSWGDHTCLANDSTNVTNGGKIFQWACSSSNGWELWT